MKGVEFLAQISTLLISAAGLISIATTQYAGDPLYPRSDYPVLSGLLCLLPPACFVAIVERTVSVYSLFTKFL